MKLSKLALALSTLVCLGGVFIVSGCKDIFGDGDVSGKKWNTTMTVDATDIKVGDDMISIKNNELTTVKVDESSLSQSGKRFFKQISKDGNQGVRTNITIDMADQKYGERSTVIGLIFDLNEYEDDDGNKSFDFTLIGINPTNKQYYVERYTGVTNKTAKNGVFHQSANSIGDYYYLSGNSWKSSKDATGTIDDWINLKNSGASYFNEDKSEFTIGVEVKQTTPGTYTVALGEISTDSKGNTAFTSKEDKITIGKDSISNYNNWIVDSKSGNLQGEVAVYGFAPYGTKIVANYVTGKTEGEDYVNAFSLAGDAEDDVYAPSLF